ncbi:hypothetical protein D3C72_1627610 [compost metagenome]
MRIEQTRDLHRQGTAARQHPPAAQVLPGSTAQGQRIDPWMLVEPAILVGQQRLQIIGRYLIGTDRIPPDPIGIGETPQRRAVLGQHHARQVIGRQRQRPQTVGSPQQRAAQQHDSRYDAQVFS